MGQILLAFLTFSSAASALFKPWIGVLAYYTLALWYPQIIWFWVFRGSRIAFAISIATIIGTIGAFMGGKLNFEALKTKQNFFLLVLWAALTASYYFAPYALNNTKDINLNSHYLITMIHKIFLFYFVSILVINDRKKFHYLIVVLLATVAYYVYWANHQYLSGQMIGLRLSGPGPGGPYTDENCFAMLFVMGTPFLYFMGAYYKNIILKYALWGLIPFAWHAVFLSGSMGGFIGLSVVTLFIAVRSRKKTFLIAIPLALAIAFAYQGGAYLKKKSMAAEADVTEVSTAQQRFNSWEAGFRMLMEHPLTGVGIGNFLPVYPKYSDTTPHVAHNTFFQFASESGIFAGLMYLLICTGLLLSYLRQIRSEKLDEDPFLTTASEAIAGSMVGFFVCAMFLNLAVYEVFYYLLVLNAVRTKLLRENLEELDFETSRSRILDEHTISGSQDPLPAR